LVNISFLKKFSSGCRLLGCFEDCFLDIVGVVGIENCAKFVLKGLFVVSMKFDIFSLNMFSWKPIEK